MKDVEQQLLFPALFVFGLSVGFLLTDAWKRQQRAVAAQDYLNSPIPAFTIPFGSLAGSIA